MLFTGAVEPDQTIFGDVAATAKYQYAVGGGRKDPGIKRGGVVLDGTGHRGGAAAQIAAIRIDGLGH